MTIKEIKIPKKYRLDEIKGLEQLTAIRETEKFYTATNGHEPQNIAVTIAWAINEDILYNSDGTIYGHEPE